MKKLILFSLIIFCALFQLNAQKNKTIIKSAIKADSIQSSLYLQGSDTLSTKSYVRSLSGSGGTTSTVSTQIKNYSNSIDTLISTGEFGSGKYLAYIAQFNPGSTGIYTPLNSSNGIIDAEENAGAFTRVNINDANMTCHQINTNNGNGLTISTNNSTGVNIGSNVGTSSRGIYVGSNGGTGFDIITNNLYGFSIDQNNYTGFYIASNNGIGIDIQNTNGTYNNGISSLAADSVSTTSGAITGRFGKLSTYSFFDAFGRLKLKQTTNPTVSVGSAAGTSATVTLLAGSNDRSGQIILTTGSGSLSTGTLVTLTFVNAYNSNIFVTFSPASSSSVEIPAKVYVDSSTSAFTLNATSALSSTGTVYKINYTISR